MLATRTDRRVVTAHGHVRPNPLRAACLIAGLGLVPFALSGCGPVNGAPEHSPTATSPAGVGSTAAVTPSPSSGAATPATDTPDGTTVPETGNAVTPPPAPPGGPASAVDVVATYGGWNAATDAVEVGGYAVIVETGGTCTLRLTGPGGAVVSASSAAEPDASTTSCGLLSLDHAQLVPGAWQGSLQYSSPNASGQVEIDPIEVP